MARAGFAVVFFVAALLSSARAFAEPDAGAPTSNADALVVELDKQIAALSTGDCVLACQALGSMRRTVERICALDPGTRCEKARDKVQEVVRRVAAACPACPEAPGVVVAKPVAPPPEAAEEVASRKGGCAACNIGANDETDLGALAAAIVGVAFAFRRRRPRRRR